MVVRYLTTADFYKRHYDALPFYKEIGKSKVYSKDANKIFVVYSLNQDEKRNCDRIFGQIGEE